MVRSRVRVNVKVRVRVRIWLRSGCSNWNLVTVRSVIVIFRNYVLRFFRMDETASEAGL